jgi:hypothetical protein
MSHPQPLPIYDPGTIVLYGVPLPPNGPDNSNIKLGVEGISGLGIALKGAPAAAALALIHGYAFEGQCYRLDKPTIMVVKTDGVPAIGCDYNDFGDGVAVGEKTYRMWFVNKLDRTVQIEVTLGMFEQLVLEANLPGRRNPNTYSSHMMLSHRSGRLSE